MSAHQVPNGLFDNAQQQAQASFKYFYQEFSWDQRRIVGALDLAVVKWAFPAANGTKVEHMWVTPESFDGVTLTGTLLNSAFENDDLVEGTPVRTQVSQLEDWLMVSGDLVAGGFSISAARAQMDPRERSQHDSAWGLPFTEPGLFHLTIHDVEPPATPSGRPFAEALAASDLLEHPASENFVDRLTQLVSDNPAAWAVSDEQGQTPLHREALAGSTALVEVFLRAGLDPTQRDVNGNSPADLANLMGWSRTAALLA